MNTNYLSIGIDPGKTGAVVAIEQNKDKVNSGGAGRYADAPRGTSGGGRVVSSSEDPLGDERAFCFVMDNQEFDEDQNGTEAVERLKHRLFTLNTMGTSVTVPPAEPGACLCEPLKAVKKLEPLKRLTKQFQLI